MASTEVYATIEQYKGQNKIKGVQDDLTITSALEAASRAIDGYCNRARDGFVESSSAARLYPGTGKRHLWIHEAMTISLVEVKINYTDTSYTSLASADWLGFQGDPFFPEYSFNPYSGLLLTPSAPIDVWTQANVRGPWLGLARTEVPPNLPTVRVTSTWGFSSTIPPLVNQATLTQAARWVKRGQSYWADAAGQASTGKVFYRRAIDPDIQMMLTQGRMRRAFRP